MNIFYIIGVVVVIVVVAGFLGLRPPRERLLRAIERSSFQRLQGREEVHGFKERSEIGRAHV